MRTIEDAVDAVVTRHAKLRKGRGRKVLEVQPRADWDKGRAIEWLLANSRLGEGGALPIYLGDDLTDEDAFGALSGTGLCIAVRGGRRATLADWPIPTTCVSSSTGWPRVERGRDERMVHVLHGL